MARATGRDDDESIDDAPRRPEMNSLIAALPWPRAARAHTPMQPLAITLAEMALVPMEPPAATAAAPEDFSRCGWLDSSLDLADGLDVIEYVDQLPDDLAIEGLVWPGDQA
jgi:hypothetical protein